MSDAHKNDRYDLEQCLKEIRHGEILLIGMHLTDGDLHVITQKALNGENHCLQLADNNLTLNGIKTLADTLKINTTLKELVLSNNPNIGDQGIEYLVDLLTHHNRTLQVLDVSKINLTDSGLKTFANSLKANVHLTEVHLDENKFTHDGITTLADALKTNTVLHDLYLSNNNLTLECVKLLADALKYNTTLKTLDLSYNENIQDQGVDYLAEVLLDSNRTLDSLKLDMTGMTDHGFKSFCDAIQKGSILKCLLVNCNQFITDACLSFLLPTLQNTTTLKLLSMRYCYLSKYARKMLRAQAESKHVRLELDLE